MYCHCSVPGTITWSPPRRLCKNDCKPSNQQIPPSRCFRMTQHTKEPKSVCAPIAACSSVMPFGRGGFLMQRDSLPLGSSRGWRRPSAPSGSPSLSLRTARSVLFTASDFSMNGRMVDSIRAFTVEGYSRWTFPGHASASSFETLMNSTVSSAPVSSVAFAPAALYLYS